MVAEEPGIENAIGSFLSLLPSSAYIRKQTENKKKPIHEIPNRKTLKNYLFGNVITDFYKVPKDDWEGVSLLPTEKFVDKRGQSFPKYKVWDYPDTLSSP